MSLFDLQDVRIAIGSIATLDLPMVVDLIGIYGLKGPYSGLAMEMSKVKSGVRNQAEAKLNQLEHSEPAGTIITSCKGYRKDEPAGTGTVKSAEEVSKKNNSAEKAMSSKDDVITNQQLKRSARSGISDDDISSDVITISR
ncbi:hypothetical protein F511_44523 [Dorcoceras hygrometricum]|uniref:Uncharacterized protein n=1 Tax=Dorcoceras hygrometricum TaxID=472368 RepID=A0A2Z7ASM8_9LAMI|nr:hypothetical protein F511_44523 [Dorcoceras hygrometricum]